MTTEKKLDFLTCLSATDGMLSQVAFARMCLDAAGGIYRDARLVAVIGDSETRDLPERWKPHFENIEIFWVDAFEDPAAKYFAQHFERYNLIRDDADLAIICDADVCLMRPMDVLVDDLCRSPAVAGVMAHYHFPINGVRGDAAADWSRVARAVLGRDIAMAHRYLFGQDPFAPLIPTPADRPAAPFYINLGVLIGPPAMIRQAGWREQALYPAAAQATNAWFGSQIAMALACDELNLPTRALPVRYNYPNREETQTLYPDELAHSVFFHYMKGKAFKRDRVFATPEAFRKFVARPQTGLEEVFRQHIIQVTGGTYPF